MNEQLFLGFVEVVVGFLVIYVLFGTKKTKHYPIKEKVVFGLIGPGAIILGAIAVVCANHGVSLRDKTILGSVLGPILFAFWTLIAFFTSPEMDPEQDR